jgi:tRNA-Thr(GGU) m(6)t(6)A37 methyltransferase TsaA
MDLTLRPVAFLRSPFAEKFGVPRQGGLIPEAEGRVEFCPEFDRDEMVRGMEAFSHVWLLTHFHLNPAWTGAGTVRPPRLGGNERVGVFASRSPNRPNPVGLSLVQLLGIDPSPGLALRIAGVDGVDGTPIFDVKPYLPWCEAPASARSDWALEAPSLRAEPAIQIPPDIEAHILRVDEGQGPRTLALFRALLRLDHQPAYQDGTDRTYGMTVAGWNLRWRSAPNGDVEVTSAEQKK